MKDADLRLQAVQTLMNRGDLPHALLRVDQLLQDYPSMPEAHMCRGVLGLQLNDGSIAFSSIETAIRLQPANPHNYYLLGLAFQLSGDMTLASQAFGQALKLDPTFSDVIVAEACMGLDANYPKEEMVALAMKSLEGLLMRDPNCIEALKRMAHETRLKEDWPAFTQWHTRWMEVAPDPKESEAMRRIPWIGESGQAAYTLAQAGDWEGVARHFEAAIQQRPFWAEAYLEVGHARYRQGRREEAEPWLLTARTLDPELSEQYLELGKKKVYKAYLEKSLEDLTRAILLDPDAYDIRERLQDPYFHYGAFAMADRVCQLVTDERTRKAKQLSSDHLRFRMLRIYTNQIGHMGHLDWYLKLEHLGRRAKDKVVIVETECINNALLGYWAPLVASVVTDPDACEQLIGVGRNQEDGLCSIMDAEGRQIADYSYGTQVATQKQWEAEGRPPLLQLTEADQRRGREALFTTFGLPLDAWFVSLHVRSDQGSRLSDGSRNAGIEAYFASIKAITDRGGWVIRMGDPGMPKLPPMPRVVDYAHSILKSDWMDVFLWGACRFFVGTNSGPIFIPPCFGVPVVATNWMPFGIPDLFLNSLCTHKHYWSEPEGRMLTYAEVVASNLGYTNAPNLLEGRGVRLIENTSEELLEVVREMLDRVEGIATYSEADQQLQARFDAVPGKLAGVGRIGRSFLASYANLLPPLDAR